MLRSLQKALLDARQRGDRVALVTLELVLSRAQRTAGGRALRDFDVASAVWAAREHFAFELELLAQAGALEGAGADAVIGELSVCDALLKEPSA